MSAQYKLRNKRHLFNLINRRNGNIPNFSLLIGAGASVSSMVMSTADMIDEWRIQLYEQSKFKEPYEKWLKEQNWYQSENEYSILFETIYDQPLQRRNYVEDCVKDATPNWGYTYLANIIEADFFNVVFTTNFDDLLNEACCSFTNCKPIVCAHDSAVSGIRVTSKRPKIIKLHGDFLYDNIKNTVKETDSLEKNMREKFTQFAAEYGLVVIGYSGNDYSVMDTLEMLLRSETYFPHGIYWCKRKESKISRKLERLLSRERVYLVEIDGFDEFMAELHDSLDLVLPDSLRNPYNSTTYKLNRFILQEDSIKNEIIKRDISSIVDHIKKAEAGLCATIPAEESPIPYFFLGRRELDSNLNEAIKYLEKAILQNVEESYLSYIKYILSIAYILSQKPDRAIEIAKEMESHTKSYSYQVECARILDCIDPKKALQLYDNALTLADNNADKLGVYESKSNCLLLLRDYESVLSLYDQILPTFSNSLILPLNRAFAFKKLGKTRESQEIAKSLLSKYPNSFTSANFFLLLDDKPGVFKAIEKALSIDKFTMLLKMTFEPDFEELRTDKQFKILYDKILKSIM